MRRGNTSTLLVLACGGLIGVAAGAAGFLGREWWDARQSRTMRVNAADQAAAAPPGSSSARKILYYWDPMLGPSSMSDKPGISAMGMDLVPVYEGDVSDGSAVNVDPSVVQNMGIQTAAVSKGSLHKTLRTVGYLEVPETGLCDITLKVNGYIDKLYADRSGMTVKKGDPLFDLYSPDLVVAEEELIAARKSVEALHAAAPEVRTQAEGLFASARRKLLLWDVPEEQIAAIAARDEAPKDITITSPAEGQVQDKAIVQGSAVQAGMKLLRIEDQRTLWLEAQVYEGQLELVKLGESADATLDGMPGKMFSGQITFISPTLDSDTRTVKVRVALANPALALKPGMYATVQIHTQPLAETVMVPGSAVIDTGNQKLVFVQEQIGHFSPRVVTAGISGDNDQTEIITGLSPGETVVTSGQFLLDVESRTQEAVQKMLNPAMADAAKPGTTSPAKAIETTAAPTGETDGIVQAYLNLTTYLQQDHADNKAADVSELVHASDTLAERAIATENRHLASTIHAAAAAMATESLDTQHKSFEKLGTTIVDLIKKDPPSNQVAGTLYVLNCVMEKADWLQVSATINNPFLPTMRTCGEVTETWTLKPIN